MAKNLRKFAPGLADTTPAHDWCEFIVLEARNSANSERSVIYGSSCGRWCAPGGNGYLPKSDSDSKRPTFTMVDMWSSGGHGGGACCCMGGPPSGGGYYSRSCRQLNRGETYCYVVAHGGCCYPASAGCNGCYSLIREMSTCCEACNSGGKCSQPRCYYNYCCYNNYGQHNACICQNKNIPRAELPADYRMHFQVKASCGQGFYNYISPAADQNMGNHTWRGGHGRRPWSAEKRHGDGNNIKGGSAYANQFERHLPTIANRETLSDNCTASAECQLKDYSEAARGHGYGEEGYTSMNCHNGCSEWICGDHHWTWGNLDQERTSGPAWLNIPWVNASRTCGGWNSTEWLHCHMGMDATNCHQGMRSAGYGGMPAVVCGAPCCCGSFIPNGYMNIKYR